MNSVVFKPYYLMNRYILGIRDRDISQWFVKSYSYIPQQKLAAQTTFTLLVMVEKAK